MNAPQLSTAVAADPTEGCHHSSIVVDKRVKVLRYSTTMRRLCSRFKRFIRFILQVDSTLWFPGETLTAPSVKLLCQFFIQALLLGLQRPALPNAFTQATTSTTASLLIALDTIHGSIQLT
ncbi:hypothetical protein DQ04_18391000 [Trypanosoma grayi]|uniref:hypothetical protein n=1 Tax=Trypanosoma grayi TaxID=71804 RepID=UPI0004F48357|nr:hypothetical protein DQ04_18391000 [Trypanosoma grayi]KEG05793.1 hypothetical protein DQ04_18391000 [Trypanosoma grayi]